MSTGSHFKTCAAAAIRLCTLLLVLPQSSAWAARGSASAVPRASSAAPPSNDEPVRHSRTAHRDPFALDLALSTLVPVSVGPDLSVELPGRVLLQAHLGWMPDLYSRTLTDTLEDAGAYDNAVGTLVDGALQSSTTWHLGAGFRPFAKLGFELRLGYAYVSLDGASSTAEIIPLVNPEIAERLNTEIGNLGINLDSQIHHFTAAAGWRWLIADRVVVRATLGYMQAFDSNSSLQIEAFPELTRLAAPTVESVLHDHYMRYIKIPVVGLAVGYRFF
jgi:hypothetical protein